MNTTNPEEADRAVAEPNWVDVGVVEQGKPIYLQQNRKMLTPRFLVFLILDFTYMVFQPYI